jgi:hypothetical protein
MASGGRSGILQTRQTKEAAMVDVQGAQIGDLIEIHGHRLGESRRTGEILEVLGTAEHGHYRVRWEDGHESLFTPGSDAVIRRIEHSKDDDPVRSHEQ